VRNSKRKILQQEQESTNLQIKKNGTTTRKKNMQKNKRTWKSRKSLTPPKT
jgi:hypothetical protein